MAVEFIDSVGGGRTVPITSWKAAVPAGTQVGDLLIHQIANVPGNAVTMDTPGWTALDHLGGAGLWVFQRYADAGDAGGWAGVTCVARSSSGTALFLDGSFITTAWRNAPAYTAAVHHYDSAQVTSHFVPAVFTPTAETEIVVACCIVPVGSGSTLDDLEIPTFTQHAYHYTTFFGSFDASSPVNATLSKPAGSVGVQGPWTMTTTHVNRMGFIVFGLLPTVSEALNLRFWQRA